LLLKCRFRARTRRNFRLDELGLADQLLELPHRKLCRCGDLRPWQPHQDKRRQHERRQASDA